MQWLTNLPLGDNRTLQIAALCGAAVALVVVLFVLYRAFFGHRLRFSGGGRARQPRLGLVDAFSLDGQRQLVLVRRDNVEHLLMIGGPNDVVVESQIVRAQPQALAPREKDAAATPPSAPKQVVALEAQTPPVKIPTAPAIPPLRTVTPSAPAPLPPQARAAVRPETPVLVPPRPQQAAAPSQQQPPLPQPPAAPPQTPAASTPPSKPQQAAEPAEESRSAPAAAPKPSVLPLRQNVPAAKPSPLPPPIVVPSPSAPSANAPKPLIIPTSSGGAQKGAPSQPVAPTPPAAVASGAKTPAPGAPQPSAPPTAPIALGAKNDPFADLDSLEAEMARLLGRDP